MGVVSMTSARDPLYGPVDGQKDVHLVGQSVGVLVSEIVSRLM